MAGVRTLKGDIFVSKIDDTHKKYLQYITNDLTQLNSDVIRIFKKRYSGDANPELEEILETEVEFYAHCVTKWGVKLGFWEKVGNSMKLGETNNILFRDSTDYGNTEIKVSRNWWVWKINQKQKFVGQLSGQEMMAEIGIIIPAASIVHRMQTGNYNFVYPDFK